MNRPLFRKFVSESAILFLAALIAVLSFAWFRTWIVGELDTAQFRQIIDLLPQDWRKFSSVDFDWLVSYLGRTALTLDEPMLILFVSMWCIVRGSDVVSGEIGRGTMELVLAQSVSRTRLYMQHMLLTILGATLLCAICWFGMTMGIMTTDVEETTYPAIRIPLTKMEFPMTFLPPQKEVVAMSSQVNPWHFFPGVANLFCFSFFLCCFAGFCSAWDRYRWRTLGIVITYYFVNALLKFAAMSSETFAWLWRLSCFSYYEPAQAIEMEQTTPGSFWKLVIYDSSGAIESFGPLANNLSLLAAGVLFLVWGLTIFHRRDIPAPI